MYSLARFTCLAVLGAAVALAAPAAADYDGADGYGKPSGGGFDVSHDGYQREGQTGAAADTTTYVVIEAEDGTTEVVDGETVIVVQEPEPLAATEQAPPAPQTVVVVQPEVQCPGAIWVDGHWAYSNGEYIWVDGHCVVERVNYVFVQPRWDFYSNVWWFVPGYYRPWGVYVGFGYYRPWHWYPPYYRSYYHTRRPVPVNRSVPYRPTTVRARPSAGRSGRGIVSPRSSVGRARVNPARTQTVTRPSGTRARTVTRAPSARSGAVARTPSTRTGAVARTPSARSRTVTRAPSTRTGTVTRARPSANRVDSMNRVRTTPARTTVVHRPPSSRVSTGAVGRARGGPTLTSSVPRSGPSQRVVSQPRVSPSRASSVNRSSVTRPGFNSSRTTGVSRPSSQRARPSSQRARPSSGWSRPSSSGWSRPGGGYGRSGSGGASRARGR